MHILNIRATHNGGSVPSETLEKKGPIIQIQLSLSLAATEIYVDQGLIIPQPLSGLALIDTGADQSCIDEGVIEQMNLQAIDEVMVCSFEKEEEKSRYPIRMEFVGTDIGMDIPVIGKPIKAIRPKITALIGRDILRHCLLVYNGTTGYITIAA